MRRLESPIVVPWIRLDRDGRAEEALALRRAREPWLAGFCLFGGEAEQVSRLTERLRDAAGRPIFVASDMERGAGQQVAGLRVLPDAAIWGLAATPSEVEAFGALTAADALSVGVDVLFAPVLDVRSEPSNPIVGNRSFGWDPDRVASLGAAFVRGALAGGCVPTAKHYPGHGATTADSHDAVPRVDESEARVVRRDLEPFLVAIENGCPALMTGHVAYPSLDPSGTIATFSPAIVSRARRAAGAGARVAIFTDALLMTGASLAGGETEAARRSLLAGCDYLLIPTDPERLAAEIVDVTPPPLLAAIDRAVQATAPMLASVASGRPLTPTDVERLDAVPARVADRAVRFAGGASIDPLASGDTLVVVDDDDVAHRGLVLAERSERAGVECIVLHLKKDAPAPSLAASVVPAALVIVSSVRAWKGHGVSPAAATLADIVRTRSDGRCQTIALAPSPYARSIHIPGTGPDVEAAIAGRLFGGA